ncbi:response regulator transcription factor [Chitinimonas viridis]|uniref:Response regulator transcription factor n=2 Tax=Chitinimonas TaxID=240411 RepID=A0ABT8B5V5_9NEIS|nr:MULTISPECIES: response regulator transcription factor [Chitinimonas]MBL8508914.1 response regulator transcription factor [Chitinimonas sp.]MDN3577612.1 response regulator transcription factor [Chitinimonas viridis]GLR15155.1 DNA-binding response regulator [Chitinimonas prasina]
MKLLLAEDDAVLADALLTSLARLGFAAEHVSNGLVAEQRLLAADYDAVILDLGLPGQGGLAVLRKVRAQKPGLPILILTALDGLEDRVAGLDAGADDYLAKPFEFVELEARLRALLRRSKAAGSPRDEARFGRLRLDRAGQRAWADDQPLDLSARELAVLDVLLSNADRVVTKEQIAAELSGDELGANAIEVYVHRLRKKIEPAGVGVRAVRGLGYLLEARPL